MSLAADANVLLSAALGGRAKLVFGHPEIREVVTTEVTFAEVQEYAVILAKKKRLSLDLVLLTIATLPVTIIDREVFSPSIPEASKRIGRRDPEDVDLLALAIHLRAPIWSNDNDFENAEIEWYTTAELLKKLGI